MWNLSEEIIQAARAYVATVKRCEATGKGWHDEKRQLAHDELMYALKRRNPEINPNDFDDRAQANELAFQIVRWHGE
jgi:hypothetical protein